LSQLVVTPSVAVYLLAAATADTEFEAVVVGGVVDVARPEDESIGTTSTDVSIEATASDDGGSAMTSGASVVTSVTGDSVVATASVATAVVGDKPTSSVANVAESGG
jgi:hypothetical protein